MTKTLPKEERRALRKALTILEDFRALDAEMPIQTAVTFMIVALNEGLALKDVADRLGMASSTASRNVAALSKHHRLGKQGHDLIENREDPMERRRKIHTLTPKGVAFRLKLNETMGG